MHDDALLATSQRVIPAIPEVMSDGRDEMNLAEWPIALISSNNKASAAQSDANTLVFRDVIKNPRTGEMVQRTFTVSATSKWGLPGPMDDEVLLALINLSKLTRFDSKKLYFTRYHLLKVLGWPTNGIYYERLKQALKRLEGVQLDFERAYWSDEEQSFVDRTFNLYNDLKIREDENSGSKKPDPRQPVFSFVSCELTWSSFLFDGLGERKLKHLDFDLYKSLKSSITKRLYRFLDKRLYNERHSWLRMSLNTFAVSHVGLADGQPPREYKRRLKPAIQELEERGFLKPLPENERFKKMRAGIYDIFIERNFAGSLHGVGEAAATPTTPPPPATTPELEALIEAGMHREQALKVIKAHSTEDVQRKLAILRWRIETGDAPKNPGAWLNDQFRNKYPEPDNYSAHLKREQVKRTREEKTKEATLKKQQSLKSREDAAASFLASFKTWWNDLGKDGQHEIDQVIRSLEHNDFERGYIADGETTIHGRAIWAAKRQMIFSERTGIKAPP